MSRKCRERRKAAAVVAAAQAAVRFEIAKLELQPGDKLLVKVPKTVPLAHKGKIAESIKAQVRVPVLVYSDEVEISILRAGEPPPADAVGGEDGSGNQQGEGGGDPGGHSTD